MSSISWQFISVHLPNSIYTFSTNTYRFYHFKFQVSPSLIKQIQADDKHQFIGQNIENMAHKERYHLHIA